MRIVHLVISLCFLAARYKTSGITISGYERETITFKCTHKWAQGNRKYFCKDPCQSDKDILIDSVKTFNEKFSLKDEGTDFTVTITGLERADSGKYWCGVDRVFGDTYDEIFLEVLDAPLTFTPSTPSSPSPSPTTISFMGNISISDSTSATAFVQVSEAVNQSHDASNPGWKFYLIVSMCVLLVTFVVWILALLSLQNKVCARPLLEPLLMSQSRRRRQFELSDYEQDHFGSQNSMSHNQNVHSATADYENIFTTTTISAQNIYTVQ
ncbi:uncharacterized protein LOC143486086 isoform X2 [Brachyhypopomus gauderio]|uniref:uncharacterized protein LOC143486086 isoform X2 n=1 Tax=Brachyhypopomus gauderio TaxID=698409 RepID=UPI0040429DAA